MKTSKRLLKIERKLEWITRALDHRNMTGPLRAFEAERDLAEARMAHHVKDKAVTEIVSGWESYCGQVGILQLNSDGGTFDPAELTGRELSIFLAADKRAINRTYKNCAAQLRKLL